MAYADLTLANIARWTGGRWTGTPEQLPRRLGGVSTDSRTAGSDDLFVALKGERFDGHDYVRPFLAAGGAAAMVAESWREAQSRDLDTARLIVLPDPLKGLQSAAAHYRDTFSLPVIAVTGSVGKTSTKEAIHAVLSQRFRVLRNAKSYNNHIGVPLTLLALRDEHEILVTELGTNHYGELDLLGSLVKPAMAMITNIGFAHLEFFNDLAGVARAKFEIFNHCQPDGLALYNADDPILRNRNYPLTRTFSYGLEHPADLRAEILGCDEEACYSLRLLGQEIKLPVSGRHHVGNSLAAAAVGVQFALKPEEIAAGLAALTAVDQRMALLRCGGVVLMNDTYNANPGSCAAALQTLADFALPGQGRRFAILGDMLELGSYSTDEHRKLADLAAGLHIDALWLYGHETIATLERAGEVGLAARHFAAKPELEEALHAAIQPGDVLLFKGSRGMRMETLVAAAQRHLTNHSK
ncbi:MAG TPA: UDP-N-acetylmuramoyl-tripeptide--D-alanyl-D-alanine ligase [bacterium]|nr:UDP-N-acetylmuramoyl-tripeptide--D-alanyl-D-alanine ligase [bacterium]